MEEDRDYQQSPAVGAGYSQSSGVNIHIHAGSSARVFVPVVSNVQAKDITISQNEAGTSSSASDVDKTSVIAEYKKSLSEYMYIREYTSCPGEHVLLTDRYVDPLIVQRHRKKKEKEKEIRSRGEDFHNSRTFHTDQHITVDELFSPEDRPNGVRPRAVILQGNSGSGKSFTAQKIIYDWANGNLFAETFDVVFHLRCSELNDVAEDVSLVELLNCSEEMGQILNRAPERVLFLVDGFDELRLSLPKKPLPVKASIKARPGAVLSSLLRGCMLNESYLLVTTRSIATENLGELLKNLQRFTEIMGFSEKGVQEYFQKFFEDDDQSRQVYDQVKANGTLYAMCFSPVMCWLICSVFKKNSKMNERMRSGFRSTTSIFVDFVFILLEHHCQGLTRPQQLDLLKSLGQLAHEGILKGRVLFRRNRVPETILNVLDSTRIPFLCTFHYSDRINVKETYSFMHLSFQEFFAALWYTFLDGPEAKLKIEELLSDLLQSAYELLPTVQFLFGLSNKAVNTLLMEKHQQAVSRATCTQLEEWLCEFVSQKDGVDLSSFILQCLYEVNDKNFVQNVMNIWETAESGIKICLSDMMDYQAAVYCLQFCHRIRKLELYRCTMGNLMILQTALSKCDKLHLGVSHVSDNDVTNLISAVGKRKKIQFLSVEDGALSDQSVRKIMSTLQKHKSVVNVHLSVKTINYTNAEIFIDTFKNNIVSGTREQKRFSMTAKYRNTEENLCSDFELSCDYRTPDEHETPHTYDVRLDSGKSGQTFKNIRLTHSASGFDWRKFLLISSNLNKIENPEFHKEVETLLSFLHSMPDLKTVILAAENLSHKYAAKIISSCHSNPALDGIWLHVDNFKDMDDKNICSLSFHTKFTYDMGYIFQLDLKAHDQSPENAEATPVLEEISLGFPIIMEAAHVDWHVLLGRLCEFWKSLEGYPLSSVLHSVPGLKGVTLGWRSLPVNWAVRILPIFHPWKTLQYIDFNVNHLKGVDEEDICSLSLITHTPPYMEKILRLYLTAHDQSPAVSSPALQEISLGFPFIMEGAHMDWNVLLGKLCEIWKSQDRYPFSSVLRSVPGLVEVTCRLRNLDENWAVRIFSILQDCTSLQYLEAKVDEWTTKSESLGIARGHALRECSLQGKAVLFLGCGHLDYTHPEHDDALRIDVHGISHIVVPCITLVMTDNNEINKIDWRQFFHLYYQLKDQTEHCLLYDQSLDLLVSAVNFIPDLKEMRLVLRFLTGNGALSMVKLMHTSPSLRKINVAELSQPKRDFVDSGNGGADWDNASFHTDSGSGTRDMLQYIPEESEHLDPSSELKVRKNTKNEFKLSLRCYSSSPDSKSVLTYISLILTEYIRESETAWRDFIQSYYNLKGLTERSSDFTEKVNTLLHILSSMSGLKVLDLGVHSLTETWASCILQLCHDNSSIDHISLLLEDEYSSDSACSSFTVERDCTDMVPSGVCLPSLCVSCSCLTSCYFQERITVKICSEKCTPSFISFTVPHPEILNTDVRGLLYRMRCLNDKSTEYDEEINQLMHLLRGIPGLQKLKLEIGNLTQSWATRMLSFRTCRSLYKICVTTSQQHMLMEDAILTIQNNWRRRDCTVILKGLRCSNSIVRCTEENWTPGSYQQCNNMVKLRVHGGVCSQLDGYFETDSESNVDSNVYRFEFDKNEGEEVEEADWNGEEEMESQLQMEHTDESDLHDH